MAAPREIHSEITLSKEPQLRRRLDRWRAVSVDPAGDGPPGKAGELAVDQMAIGAGAAHQQIGETVLDDPPELQDEDPVEAPQRRQAMGDAACSTSCFFQA